MIYYEMLILLTPDISQENFDLIKTKFSELITKEEGIIKNYDKWGKYLLSYKIKKYSYGIYVLFRFGIKNNITEKVLSSLQSLCKLKFNNTIMRYIFVKLGKNISDVYCKPDSLEDAPRREKAYDIDDVISRKNKYTKNNENTFGGAAFSEKEKKTIPNEKNINNLGIENKSTVTK